MERDGGLERSLRFGDFSRAFAFMARVALEAERMGHHPTWTNTWDRVWVRLTTHDAGGVVTDKDRALAVAIDRIAAEMGAE